MNKKGSIATIKKGFKFLFSMDKSIIPLVLLSSVSTGLFPFVNVYFTAEIIGVLSTTKDIKTLINLVLTAVFLNLILFFTTNYVEQIVTKKRSQLCSMEETSVSKMLFSADYPNLEDATFQGNIKKHKENLYENGSFFWVLITSMKNIISGIITTASALVLLVPMFKIGLTKTGESFIERPIFLLSIFAFMAVAIVIIFIVSTNTQKKWFEFDQQYTAIWKTFSFYMDMIKKYKSGKEIRIYNEQDMIEHHATDTILNEGMQIRKKLGKITSMNSSMIAIIAAILGFGIYIFIAIKGQARLFEISDLVKYAGSFMQCVVGVRLVADTLGMAASIIPGMRIYFDLMDSQSTREKGTKTVESTETYLIEFKNVSFKYPSADTYALKNFSIKLSNNENMAVVGRNGSGKTTFIKLLCRMYDPDEGEILLNGKNIKEYDEDEYNKLFSVVFQDFKLFAFSLAENIACGDDWDEKKIKGCLDASGASSHKSLFKDGLKTAMYKELDEDGVEISGGEAQMLALSRALYKDAPIVILDEPTAALDPIAEHDIYTKFNSLVEKKTAIYISHRLSSCRFCTNVAVFDNGSLVQLGTHEQLVVDTGGKYFELWDAQAKYYCD